MLAITSHTHSFHETKSFHKKNRTTIFKNVLDFLKMKNWSFFLQVWYQEKNGHTQPCHYLKFQYRQDGDLIVESCPTILTFFDIPYLCGWPDLRHKLADMYGRDCSQVLKCSLLLSHLLQAGQAFLTQVRRDIFLNSQGTWCFISYHLVISPPFPQLFKMTSSCLQSQFGTHAS